MDRGRAEGLFQGSGDPIPGRTGWRVGPRYARWGIGRGGSSGITLRVALISINIIITHVSPRPLDSK